MTTRKHIHEEIFEVDSRTSIRVVVYSERDPAVVGRHSRDRQSKALIEFGSTAKKRARYRKVEPGNSGPLTRKIRPGYDSSFIT